MKVGKISTVLFNNYSNPEKTNVKQNYHESRQQIKANNPLLNYQQSVSFGMAKIPGLRISAEDFTRLIIADDLFTSLSQSLKKMDGDFAGILEDLYKAEEPVKKTFALLTDEKGQTALHTMFSLPYNKKYFKPDGIISQYWEKIIGILSPEEQLKALKIQDKDGYTIGHLSANNSPEGFKMFMDGIKGFPAAERVKILELANQYGNTLGHFAAYNSPEVFKTFMKGIKGFPAAERVKILDLANKDGDTIGHWAAENSPETLEIFMKSLSGLPADIRRKILAAKNKTVVGNTIGHRAALKSPETLETFMQGISNLPAATRAQILTLANNAGNTIGHLAAENKSPETLEMFMKSLSGLSAAERVKILTAKNAFDNTIGHLAALKSPETLEMFMQGISNLPAEARAQILTLANPYGNTIGHLAAYKSPETLEMFMKGISNLSVTERIKLLTAKNKPGDTVIQSLYKNNLAKYKEFARNIAYDESLSKEETIKLLRAINIDRRLDELIAKVEKFAE